MFCPNCGTTISTAQSYCRACGLGLEKITQSVAEQRPTELQESVQQRKERIERWGVAALSVFGGGLLIITLYHIVKMMVEGRVLAGVGYLALLLLLCCGLISVILFAKANAVGESKTKPPTAAPDSIPAS
ncbi:MAG TPA: zinc ribbon domain-containing protein, partial [Pyrinomonadaceae bacterium]|nr:zinc ribbon domain-containing protein [Pyrinomonadaceae bacterium]